MRLNELVGLAIVALLTAMGASGCSAARVHMRLAPELVGVEPLPVQGRLEHAWTRSLGFGPWLVATASAPDRRLRSLSVASPRKEVAAERNLMGFELDVSHHESAGRLSTQVDCRAFGRVAKLTRFEGRLADETEITAPGSPRIDCEFTGAVTGTLVARPVSVTQREHGTAQFGGSLWRIQSVNQTATQRGDFPVARFGYEGMLDGRVVAAVETTGPGRVWTLPRLDERLQSEWAAIASALLHYASLLETLDH